MVESLYSSTLAVIHYCWSTLWMAVTNDEADSFDSEDIRVICCLEVASVVVCMLRLTLSQSGTASPSDIYISGSI